MGSLKENFIKKFIMSLLWSVDKPESSEKPEKSPENLENSDSKEGEEKSPEKESTEEREKSKSPVENLEDSDSDIEIVFEVKAPPKTRSKSRSESEYSDDSDSEIEEILPNGRPNLGLGGTVAPKDRSDSESENGIENLETPTKDTPKTEKKNLKRPIASENSDQSEDEAKRTKCSSIRNEISSSLSSSSQKKRTADSADFDSEDDGDEVDCAPKKVLKSDETVKKTDETVEETDEKADELMPVQKSSTTKSKKFSKVVSPMKNVSIEKEAGDSNSEDLDNLEKGEETDKLLVKKDVITDAKALLADQEKSEERGKKLLEAFDD